MDQLVLQIQWLTSDPRVEKDGCDLLGAQSEGHHALRSEELYGGSHQLRIPPSSKKQKINQ
jgi:hypothetical protein